MNTIHMMAEDFKLLADKTRLTILALLKEKEMCVCDIMDELGVSQSSTSQHLRKLKSAGMVTETRRGQWVYYSLLIEGKPYIHEAIRYLPTLEYRSGSTVEC
ncbi:ArsR/SmtB family transcription factor [Cohnella phaseoli]|uniref:ArsR family transcriptional regulator n=1 Tax=Cohnella phaseoli TaxID=456490 RepID=A0A3D9JPJ4_9BACL|nr:metalloregulator ArsR/SmtB family transcription factor [Cohnella phaseoli]RED76043.1 ArsR family transcriptional regulator [Cohnella phaseoli]